MRVPNGLEKTVVRVHGDAGRLWLARLPALIAECRRRWSLELERPFENLSYNLVLPGRTSQGAQIVLKLGVPSREMLTEAAALNLYAGVGAVRLLADDATRGVLLLERAQTGRPLHELQGDEEATATAATLMRRLWREPPATHAFPSLAEWFRAFERLRTNSDGSAAPFPPELLARAGRTFDELNASSGRAVILHGDLHHANILSSTNGEWVAIDPKGICGDAGYEVGTFMLNRLPAGATDSALREIFSRRLSIFSDELRISRERLAAWAFAHAVLSAVWSFEESAEWRDTVRLAQLLAQA